MGKRLTHEEFLEKVYSTNKHVTILGNYVNVRTKILTRCNYCGREWMATPNELYRDYDDNKPYYNSCPNSVRHNTKFFDNLNPNVKLLEEYPGKHKKVKCLCKTCNEEFLGNTDSLYMGCGHNKCGRQNQKSTITYKEDDFVSKLKSKNSTILLLSDYNGMNEKVTVKCSICNSIWERKASKILSGRSVCQFCANKKREKEYCDKIKERYSKYPFVIIDEEINSRSIVHCKCSKCGKIYNIKFSSLYKGVLCPCQNRYKGERAISEFLSKNNIQFDVQVTYNDLRGVNNGMLSYDFYVHGSNLLIEYQGNFHDGTACTQSVHEFYVQQEHDNRKRKYAKDHNIQLLEIWYYDYDNIETILSERLNIYNNDKKPA